MAWGSAESVLARAGENEPQGHQSPPPGWGIVGHRPALGLLIVALLRERVSHAYLFTGPEGVGKRTLALAFARALNCAAPAASDAAPCGVCPACRKIGRGVHPDVRVIETGNGSGPEAGSEADTASEGRRGISIDAIRWLRGDAALRPSEGKRKVYLVVDAHRLSGAAFHAVLKTLEEPPGETVILLTATAAEALPATVASRCQHLRLFPLPLSEVIDHLVGAGLAEPPRARLLAGLSSGRIGWALSAARGTEEVERHAEAVAALWALGRSDPGERLKQVEAMLGRGGRLARDEMGEMLAVWAGVWRDALLAKLELVDRIANTDRAAELERLAAPLSLGQLARAARRTSRAMLQLQENVNPRLALEALVLELPGGAQSWGTL